MSASSYEAGFFVLRTPSLSVPGEPGAGLTSPSDSSPNPFIREALWLASPEFSQLQSSGREEGKEGARGKEGRSARTRYRYLSRRTYRATPFGLFAGVTLGEVGKETCLELAGRDGYQRTTRLDFEYLHGVVQALLKLPEARRALAFRANSSLWETSEGYLYAESRFDGKRRSTHQVRLEKTPYLRHVLEAAREGVTGEALAGSLLEAFPGVSPSEAEAYVAQLIESQVLVPECEPLVTGEEAAQRLAEELMAHEATAPYGRAL